MRMMALEASAVGNWIVKSPEVDVLSAPKSRTATAGFVAPSAKYIKAPRAVIVELVQVTSEKSKYAVVPEDVGTAATVSVLPPAV